VTVATTTRTVHVRTTSADETRSLGAALAAVARAGDRIALLGPLGAGKTQLAKGFGAGLGVTDEVTSPSFTLMAEHAGRLPLFHLDLYRLTGSEEAVADGMIDEREDDGVTLVEWADRLDARLDADRLTIRILPRGEAVRAVTIEADATGRHAAYPDAAAAWAAARPDARSGARTTTDDGSSRPGAGR
jgi:tRNA threonylcarbamoyladenosine biosynthesis protein TsaE